MKSSRISQTRCGMICGIIMLAGGFVLLSMKLGWIPEDFFRSVPLIPLAMMMLGAFLLVSSVARGRGSGKDSPNTGI